MAVALIPRGAAGAGDPELGEPSCTLADAVLHLDNGWFDMRVTRAGDEIVAQTSQGIVPCDGGPATVFNVDRVRLPSDDVTLDLGNGAFAPGLTDEGDGSSEIEFKVRSRAGLFFLKLGAGGQNVRAGSIANRVPAINLNAGEANPDADLKLRKLSRRDIRSEVLIFGQRGADRLRASGGPEFEGPFPERFYVLAGGGSDLVRGGRKADAVLGGRGQDDLKLGEGKDLAFVRDGRRDSADCGPGRDLVVADRQDQLRRCEDENPSFDRAARLPVR